MSVWEREYNMKERERRRARTSLKAQLTAQ